MPIRYPHPTKVHDNGHLLCAVDVETTGLDYNKHSIIEICVLPLLPDYTPNKKILPFNTCMRPIEGREVDAKAMQVNRLDIAWIMTNCLDGLKVADLFVEWFEKLQLGIDKKIIPLAQNWPFDRQFIIEWLGFLTYDMCFQNREYRDTLVTAGLLNDRADMRGEPIPFPRKSLSSLSAKYGITNPDPHRAQGDCYTTAAVYRELVFESMK